MTDLAITPEAGADLLLRTLASAADWRWTGEGERFLCDQVEDPDRCERHEEHLRVLHRQEVRGVPYALAWDPTWGQLVVTELGSPCWFLNPQGVTPSREELIRGFEELRNALLDATRTGN